MKLGVGREGSTPRGKARTKRERHVDERCRFADRADHRGGSSEVAGDAEQLGLRVADVQPGKASSLVVANGGVTGEPVLDLSETRRCRRPWRGLCPAAHTVRLPEGARSGTPRHSFARRVLRTRPLHDGTTSTYRTDTSGCYNDAVLELAILGMLKQHPMHGYDLRKRLRDDCGPLENVSFGSLYPALARLEASGAVRAVAPFSPRSRSEPFAPPMAAMTGSLTGERAALMARRATAKAAAALGGRGTRARKVYEITPHGELLFGQLLEAPDPRGEESRSFSLRLAFARHLTPSGRVRLLERRRIQLSDRCRDATRALAQPDRVLDRYEHAIAEHAKEIAESDLSWIERLLSAERLLVDETADSGARAERASTSNSEGRVG